MPNIEEQQDFMDLQNSLTLEKPENRLIAATFVQYKVLDMAAIFKEIRDNTFSSEILYECVCGNYYPLDPVEALESIADESEKIMLEECPNAYHQIIDSAVELRNEYARIVASSNILADKWGMDPIEAIMIPEGRQRIFRLAFPEDVDMAADCLTNLFLQYRLIRLIDPIRNHICSNLVQWQKIQEIMDHMPKKDISWLLETNTAYAVIEAEKLYAAVPYITSDYLEL